MKKWMSLGLCVLLLLSLTACGGTDKNPDTADENYAQGMAKLEEGNLTEAYDLFQRSADPKAAEMLEKFVFVPTAVTCEDSKGADYITTYTYDERGNLLENKSLGKYNWNSVRDTGNRYSYDEANRRLSHTYWDGDGFISKNFFFYDEAGNETLNMSYEKGDLTLCTRSTYDERGNLLTEKHYTEYEQDISYSAVHTYDDQDRLLTSDITNEKGNYVYRYTYAEDGSYHYSYVRDVEVEDSMVPVTHTHYYDKEDRLLGYLETAEDGTVYEKSETRYGADGRVIYDYSLYDWPGLTRSETLMEDTLNDKGETILSQRTEDGEVVSATEYAYDERGNMVSMRSSNFRTMTRTYDEQNRILTSRETWPDGWENNTYTYDEAGNRVKKEWESSVSAGTVEYTYDAWGNPLSASRCHTDESFVSRKTAKWELRYYPDGVDNTIRFVINEANDVGY
ncbi:MAG: hypothetical protein IJN04_04175 [Clostridia bacterium]|nr:hypothetical protein [Clostridia bacterium]